jgi:hypothetical protein
MERFGWIVRKLFSEGRPQYLHSINLPSAGPAEFGFLNSRHNVELLDTALKNAVLVKLRERWPDSTFEAVEVFWKGE